MRDGAVAIQQDVVAALRDAVHASGSRLRDVALALPAGAAIKKMLSLPAMLREDELEQLVEAEAGETLPFPRDEIAIDFAIAGPSAAQPDYVDVALVAARRERIDQRVAVAKAAGLRPLIVDIESHALMSAITRLDSARDNGPAQVIAALWLSADRSQCLFMAGGVLSYEHELGLAAADVDVASVERICQEFDRALRLFQTATAHARLDRIYLLGAIPCELPSVLQQHTGTPVILPDPLLYWSGGTDRIAADAADSPSACMLACGLALRSFDP
jgi:type IV pilus assembly protein PilM